VASVLTWKCADAIEWEAGDRTEFQDLRQDIARLEQRVVEFRAELKQDIAHVEQKVAGVRSELIKMGVRVLARDRRNRDGASPVFRRAGLSTAVFLGPPSPLVALSDRQRHST